MKIQALIVMMIFCALAGCRKQNVETVANVEELNVVTPSVVSNNMSVSEDKQPQSQSLKQSENLENSPSLESPSDVEEFINLKTKALESKTETCMKKTNNNFNCCVRFDLIKKTMSCYTTFYHPPFAGYGHCSVEWDEYLQKIVDANEDEIIEICAEQ